MGSTTVRRLRPDGLIASTGFTHGAVIPPQAMTVLVGGQNAVDADGASVGSGDIAAQVDRRAHTRRGDMTCPPD